jgi:hypothetical protein
MLAMADEHRSGPLGGQFGDGFRDDDAHGALEAFGQLEATTRFWRNWLARAAIPDHELGPLIMRSALTIKGLMQFVADLDRNVIPLLVGRDVEPARSPPARRPCVPRNPRRCVNATAAASS